MSTYTDDEIRADLDAALQLVFGLAARGQDAWRMCVPPQDDDSDILLVRVIEHAERLLAEREEARAGIEKARVMVKATLARIG